VAASELLRGAIDPAHRQVESLLSRLLPIEPPSWRRCWYESGWLLPKIFPDHEAIGLARLQNDCLIAFTARYTGSVLLTADRHFAMIRRYIRFSLQMIEQ
jgi:hypothetical protein